MTTYLDQAFEPEQLETMDAAFQQACRELGVGDRKHPVAELVAKRIVQVAQTGVRTRVGLYLLAMRYFKFDPQ